MRVVVTGGAGFLGSHLTPLLEERGFDVTVPRRVDVDLTDTRATGRLFGDVRPTAVFHLAAEVGGIGANQSYPGRYWYANQAMGMNVLEQSRLHGVSKLVLVGTICAYPRCTSVPFREDDLWLGYPEDTNAPYGIAKKGLLVGAQAYRQQYGLNTIYMLPVNLYGPGDNFDLNTSHVIPAMIRRMLDAQDRGEQSVTLWGDGSPTREFLHVADCARALVLAFERYDGAEPVNLGTGQEIRISELASLIARATGFQGQINWDASRPNGQPRRTVDTTRAERFFGFRAEIGLAEGIEQTVAWFRARPSSASDHSLHPAEVRL